jgi:GNAT superfamily N-acetyltransferase
VTRLQAELEEREIAGERELEERETASERTEAAYQQQVGELFVRIADLKHELAYQTQRAAAAVEAQEGGSSSDSDSVMDALDKAGPDEDARRAAYRALIPAERTRPQWYMENKCSRGPRGFALLRDYRDVFDEAEQLQEEVTERIATCEAVRVELAESVQVRTATQERLGNLVRTIDLLHVEYPVAVEALRRATPWLIYGSQIAPRMPDAPGPGDVIPVGLVDDLSVNPEDTIVRHNDVQITRAISAMAELVATEEEYATSDPLAKTFDDLSIINGPTLGQTATAVELFYSEFGHPDQLTHADIGAQCSGDGHHLFCVVDDDNVTIAAALYVTCARLAVVELRLLATRQAHRGQGYASALMSVGERYFANRLYQFVYVRSVTVAAPMYASRGYVRLRAEGNLSHVHVTWADGVSVGGFPAPPIRYWLRHCPVRGGPEHLVGDLRRLRPTTAIAERSVQIRQAVAWYADCVKTQAAVTVRPGLHSAMVSRAEAVVTDVHEAGCYIQLRRSWYHYGYVAPEVV